MDELSLDDRVRLEIAFREVRQQWQRSSWFIAGALHTVGVGIDAAAETPGIINAVTAAASPRDVYPPPRDSDWGRFLRTIW